MLSRLYISNFALIREMEVEFPGKLTVITGETGAGKSIFLEAMGLALGKRADLSGFDHKEKKCVVEAEFDGRQLDLKNLFEEHSLEYDPKVILRREISAEGRSRSFVNDSVVQLNTLKAFAEQLVDIHSQHQTLMLNENKFQLDLLDGFAGTQELYLQYRGLYNGLLKMKKNLAELEEKEIQARKELDYFDFLFKELEEAGIEAGKLHLLQSECKKLENAEAIKTVLVSSAGALGEGENNALVALSQARQLMGSISKYGDAYEQLHGRINSVYIELKDVYEELGQSGAELHFDGGRLDELNGAIDKLSRLMKKHNAGTEEELLKTKTEIEQKLLAFGSLEEEILRIRKHIAAKTSECIAVAQDLSKKRQAAVTEIEKKTRKMLTELSMPNANFRIDVEQQKELGLSGLDNIRFLFSANKGTELAELQKVASGGELSRLMLCLKALLAGIKNLPTIIFDEIDTGVSGEVAARIGAILQKMSGSMQVVTITHLPQMASRGEHHLFVYKKDEAKRTNSYIKTLSGDERISEIAKMLSAGKPGESALQNARELLSV